MDNYSLNYILQDSKDKLNVTFRDKGDLLSFVKNLHKGIATIEGTPVYGMEGFSYFQIWLCNYDSEVNPGSYIDFIDGKTDPEFYDVNNGFVPRNEDITNDILDEVNFSSVDRNMEFKNNNLRVFGDIYPIKRESKLRDILEIIFSIESEIITYQEMLKVYKEGSFVEIIERDFSYETIRGLLKNKLKIIQEKSKIEKNIFSISIRGITKNI